MKKTEQLPAKIKTIWLLSAGGSLAVGAAVTVGGLFAARAWHWPSWLVVVAGGLTVAEVLIEVALVPYRYRFSGYQIDDDSVEISSGFIMKRQVSIPIAKIQNVTLKAGPLMQAQKLEQVVVATAASSHEIEGVTPETATALRATIMRRALEVRDNDL